MSHLPDSVDDLSEVFISYCDTKLPTHLRREKLLRNYFFKSVPIYSYSYSIIYFVQNILLLSLILEISVT